MGPLIIILFVISTEVSSITVSSNGNSPEIKMVDGMMVDIQDGFVPMASKWEVTSKSNNGKNRKLNNNSPKLSINERYRRLIPYMTFYYANDLAQTTEAYNAKNVEVERAEIVEAKTLEQHNEREPKKIIYPVQRNIIPRYQGNRLTQFNIALANPNKIVYKPVPVYQNVVKVTPTYNPQLLEHNIPANDYSRFIQKSIVKSPSVPFTGVTRKPYLNIYSNGDSANIQYYFGEKEQEPKYKLVPYEQTPPVKVVSQIESVYDAKNPIPVPVLISKEQVYINPKPVRPHYIYDDINNQQLIQRKQPSIVSESYYEKRRPSTFVQPVSQPVIESGFKPIIPPIMSTEAPSYTTDISPAPVQFVENEKPIAQEVETVPVTSDNNDFRPNYYQYVVDQPVYKPEEYEPTKSVTLADLLNSLQLNKSIPKPITRENVGSSIKTLLQVLNALKAMTYHNDVDSPVLSTPKPFEPAEVAIEVTDKSIEPVTPSPIVDADLHEEPNLAPVNVPSQHLDDFSSSGGTSQHFPLQVNSDEEGGTPGRPGVDYPVLTVIPTTSFNCKTQRYKGFFADPDTRCQVWHYCDLNGGQASFLCPNGTIFSQAALTCDWWFNVKCASTTQLYVLNESLYKYILPHSPKFPEDYSGPLVDKYLSLKFKEMEEQFKKNKNKQSASEKIDSEESDESTESSSEKETEDSEGTDKVDVSTVSEASVVVGSPGTTGNVERLHDE